MFEFILLDMDNTILDFNQAEHIALRRTLEQMGLEPRAEVLEAYSKINQAQWKLLELGQITRAELKVRRYRLLFETFGINKEPAAAAGIYETFLSQGHYFVEGAEELLQTLSQTHRLYMVTNGTAAVQKGRIKSAELTKYFDAIFISEEIGADKPNPEYFRRCFARIPNFEKESAVIIGDSLSSDILGGKNAGIATVWFNPNGKKNDSGILPDYTVKALSEIPPLVSREP